MMQVDIPIPQALVLCATREIAEQSAQVINEVGKFIGLLHCCVFTGGLATDKMDAERC